MPGLLILFSAAAPKFRRLLADLAAGQREKEQAILAAIEGRAAAARQEHLDATRQEIERTEAEARAREDAESRRRIDEASAVAAAERVRVEAQEHQEEAPGITPPKSPPVASLKHASWPRLMRSGSKPKLTRRSP